MYTTKSNGVEHCVCHGGIIMTLPSLQVEPGSIIVVLTLVDSNTNTEGANITILVGQITQDVS